MNQLFLDPGSSGTKVLAYAGFCHGYFVPPGVEAIAPLGEKEWEDERWNEYPFGVGILEMDGKTYRVGETPRTCVTAQSKGPQAVAKAIAAIASIDCGRGDSYSLGLLLPCDEFQSHQEMERRIESALPTARFNGKKISAKLTGIRTNPEGSGLIPQPKGVQVAVMIGHTDISLVRFQNGRINANKSQTFANVGVGAIALSMQIPGTDIDIARAVSKGRYSDLVIDGFDEDLIRASSDRHRAEFVQKEIAPLFLAYPWSGVDSVVIGGGGVSYLRQYIESIIPVKTKRSNPGKGLGLFGVSDPRFHDLYGMTYRRLSSVIEAKLLGEDVQSVECEVV